MKLSLVLFLGFSLLINCSIQKTTQKIMEGEITKEELKYEFSDWYNDYYTSYNLDTATLNNFPNSFNNDNNKIEVFMGTWCGDSHRDTPRIIKLMEFLKFSNYTIIALDRDKKSDKNYEAGKNILRIPTIIVYDKNNKELNRIIESPVNSLEKDLLEILASTSYVPNYFQQK